MKKKRWFIAPVAFCFMGALLTTAYADNSNADPSQIPPSYLQDDQQNNSDANKPNNQPNNSQSDQDGNTPDSGYGDNYDDQGQPTQDQDSGQNPDPGQYQSPDTNNPDQSLDNGNANTDDE